MSQEDILKILSQEKRPVAVQEISCKLQLNEKRVFEIVKILLKHNEIKCIEIPRDLAMKMYKCKRRMRLYYV